MNKYEQLIEYIINEDEAKAKALFHNIVVERSREIYESLMDEEPAVSHDRVGNLAQEVAMDENGMTEEEAMRCIDYIRDHAPKFAEAKAQTTYLENFLKSKKAMLMAEETGTLGAKEAYAYAHPDYEQQLKALQMATEEEEKLKYMLIAAQLRVEVWKTTEYTKRQELKNL